MVLESLFEGPECTIQEILNSKEQRVAIYTDSCHKNKCNNTVTLCVNMPGNIKDNKASRLFFRAGKYVLKNLISSPVFIIEKHDKTGHEMYQGTNLDSTLLKKTILDLETKYHWMRMLDIDVVDRKIGHVSRTMLGLKEQRCFICGNAAKLCASQIKHSSEEIKKSISEYYAEAMSFLVGTLAYESLEKEALCTPKPGLVDCNNNGSHNDMNVELLIKSAATLQPYFEKMCYLGFLNAPFKQLRCLGREAEVAMYKATNNVNTHKGAIFCLGLLSYCFAKCIASGETPHDRNICLKVKTLVHGIDSEISQSVKAKRGLGARGQALDGYSVLTEYALPFFKKEKNTDERRAMCLTLLLLISKINDANILSRSDAETHKWAQKQCENLFNKKACDSEIEKTDREFIKKNISPGGSADLLAATYFLSSLPDLV